MSYPLSYLYLAALLLILAAAALKGNQWLLFTLEISGGWLILAGSTIYQEERQLK